MQIKVLGIFQFRYQLQTLFFCLKIFQLATPNRVYILVLDQFFSVVP